MIRIIKTKEELLQLKTGRKNRFVGYNDEGKWSEQSIKSGTQRTKTIGGYIDNYGWTPPSSVYSFKDELLEGNGRVSELKKRIKNGTINYDKFMPLQKLRLLDLSDEINPKTKEPFTFDEACDFVNVLNIHTQIKHKIDDIVDTECHNGNPVALKIRELAEKYNVSTGFAADAVTGYTGASRNNYVHEKIVEGNTINPICEEFLEYVDELYIENRQIVPIVNFKTKPIFPALQELYTFFKKNGEESLDAFKYIFLKITKQQRFHNQFQFSKMKNNAECKQKILQLLMHYEPKSNTDNSYITVLKNSLTEEQKNKINNFITSPEVKKSRFVL